MEEFSAKALFAKIHARGIEDESLETYPRKALPLIVVDEGGNLELGSEAEQLLRHIPGKISIVSVCGPLKSGKSLLSNLLVSDSGFELAHDSSYHTSGIWLWGEPITTKDSQILLLDCQATVSIEDSTKTDMKIYALLVLLSSVIVFNSKGVIDEEVIKQLTLLICFSDVIDFSMDYGNTPEEIQERVAAEAPKFVWVLRDFQIAILDDEGKTLSPKEYMESILNMPSFMGKNAPKNEMILQSFLKVFNNRDCSALPRPTNTENELKTLQSVALADLRPKLREDFEKFKLTVFEGCPIKKINDSEVTGFQLVTMIQQIIELVNNEETPNLYEVIDLAARIQYEEILHKAKQKFAECKNLDLTQMPFEECEIIEKFQQAKDACLEMFSTLKPKNNELEIEMLENFHEFFQDSLKTILKANYSASEAFNVSLLETLYREIIIKLDQGDYFENFEGLETDWIKTMHMYETKAKGPGRFAALSEFSRTHQQDAFKKFFVDIENKYSEKIQNLRDVDKNRDDLIKAKQTSQARKEIIDTHISELQEALSLDDIRLEELLEVIESEVKKSKLEVGMSKRSGFVVDSEEKVECKCLIF